MQCLVYSSDVQLAADPDLQVLLDLVKSLSDDRTKLGQRGIALSEGPSKIDNPVRHDSSYHVHRVEQQQ